MTEYIHKTLICQRCGDEFPFAPGEQAFYESRGMKGEPKLCPECRAIRRQNLDDALNPSNPDRNDGRKKVQKYPAVCASCGVKTEVPFKPKHDRPVYCKECYEARRHLA